MSALIGHPKKEHYDRLRLGVGLTDYSTYQAFDISGGASTEALNGMVLSDLTRLPIGRATATYMLREDGTLLADVLIWNQGGAFLVLAETTETDSLQPWISKHSQGASVRDLASESSFIGLDGPFAWELLKETIGVRILGLRYMEAMADQKLLGFPVDIIRAGKTGEYGYVLKTLAADGAELRERLLEAGLGLHLAPCDAAAVDLCKLENRFTNVYKEGVAAKNVLELNCRIQVSSDKGEYIGREAIERTMADGSQRRLIGIKTGGVTTPVEGSAISYQGEKIGELVAAGFSWTLNAPVGLGLISSDYAYVGCNYKLDGSLEATTVSAPFVLNKSIQIRPQEDSFKTVDWSYKL